MLETTHQPAAKVKPHTCECPECDNGLVYSSDDPSDAGHECTDCDGEGVRVGYLQQVTDRVIAAAEVEVVHDETYDPDLVFRAGRGWCAIEDCPVCVTEHALRAQIECWYDSECDGERIIARLGKCTAQGIISYRDDPHYLSYEQMGACFVEAAEEAIAELLWSVRAR